MSVRPESIKVACYNILAEKYIEPCKPMFKNCWETRKESIAQRIKGLDADILCLQEVDRFEDLSSLLSKHGYKGFLERDIALFYKTDRFTCLSTEILQYNDTHWKSVQKVSLQAVKGGSPFNVLNTHVSWVHPYQAQEMQQLQKFAMQQKGPTVLCGDLNATPDYPPLQNLCKAGFRDTLSKSSKKTYIDQGRRLDYIYVSQGIRTKSADVDGEPKILNTEHEPSDHLPITAQLIVPSGLQTINTQKSDTIGHKLVEALNEGMQLQEHTQEYYDAVAPLFHLLLDTVEKDNPENFVEALLLKCDSALMKGVKPVLCSAIRRYEHQCLQEIISLLQKDQTKEALSLFSTLSKQLRHQVYLSVYEVEKGNGRTITHSNFGEVSFHGRDDLEVSNEVRLKSIDRFLLREVQLLLKSDKENEGMLLFETLSTESVRNAVYGKTYAAAQKKGLKTEHPDFGKAAFHRLEKCDVPNDLRQESIESYLSISVDP